MPVRSRSRRRTYAIRANPNASGSICEEVGHVAAADGDDVLHSLKHQAHPAAMRPAAHQGRRGASRARWMPNGRKKTTLVMTSSGGFASAPPAATNGTSLRYRSAPAPTHGVANFHRIRPDERDETDREHDDEGPGPLRLRLGTEGAGWSAASFLQLRRSLALLALASVRSVDLLRVKAEHDEQDQRCGGHDEDRGCALHPATLTACRGHCLRREREMRPQS